MTFRIENGLPLVKMEVIHGSNRVLLERVLIDTGSAGTILRIEPVSAIGLVPEANDAIRRIVGVGGTEFVFVKRVDRLKVAGLEVDKFDVEIGQMDYGVELDGILGTDFFLRTKVAVDFDALQLSRAPHRGET